MTTSELSGVVEQTERETYCCTNSHSIAILILTENWARHRIFQGVFIQRIRTRRRSESLALRLRGIRVLFNVATQGRGHHFALLVASAVRDILLEGIVTQSQREKTLCCPRGRGEQDYLCQRSVVAEDKDYDFNAEIFLEARYLKNR